MVVTQQLDPDLDFRTFRVDDFGWGGLHVELTAIQSFFQGRVDLPDSTGIDVDATVSIDIETGLVTWILQTVNPTSGEAPSDALAGFLPPNNPRASARDSLHTRCGRRARRQPVRWSMLKPRLSLIRTSRSTRRPSLTRSIPVCQQHGAAATSQPARTGVHRALVRQHDEGGSALKSFDVFVSDDGGPFTTLLVCDVAQ